MDSALWTMSVEGERYMDSALRVRQIISVSGRALTPPRSGSGLRGARGARIARVPIFPDTHSSARGENCQMR